MIDKDFYRKIKRAVKKKGNKQRRYYLKRQLEENPQDAAFDEYDFGRFSSKTLNGIDDDKTRKNKIDNYIEGQEV